MDCPGGDVLFIVGLACFLAGMYLRPWFDKRFN